MRFIPTNCLREGMILAKSLYGTGGVLLLQRGEKLKTEFISHLVNHGFQGVYIRDKLSKEIQIVNIVSDELRNSAEKVVRAIFEEVQTSGCMKELTDAAESTVHKITEEIIRNKDLMVNMIDLKSYDNYTYRHSVNVGILSIILGASIGMTLTQLYRLGLSAMLHDIGKVFIDREIITKPEQLSDEEFEEIKRHPLLGYNYLQSRPYTFPSISLTGILDHHERIDGSGYPRGLSDKEISMFGRIISITDVYDAMTSDRPYRRSLPPAEVMEYLMGASGTLFDPDYVLLFTRKVAAYPLGTCVMLSNGLKAIVTQNYPDCCLRPRVKLINDDPEPIYLDLRSDRSLADVTITKVIKM
jgi:HD-GYP domain-containing protein (c-di-GMP phosphodiesterase class II)